MTSHAMSHEGGGVQGAGPWRLVLRGTSTLVLAVLALPLLFDLCNWILVFVVGALDMGRVTINYPLVGGWTYPLHTVYVFVWVSIYGLALGMGIPALWAIKRTIPGPLSGWPFRIVNLVAWSYSLGWALLWVGHALPVGGRIEGFSFVPAGLAILFPVATAAWHAHRRGLAEEVGTRWVNAAIIGAILLLVFSFLAPFAQAMDELFGLATASSVLTPVAVGLWLLVVAVLLVALPVLLRALHRTDGRGRVTVGGLLAMALVILPVELWIGGLPLVPS